MALKGKGPLSGQDKSRWLHNWLRRETVSLEMDPKASSPQKHAVKGRSKSTEEIQQAKKAFHTPQKSLPSTGEESNIQDSAEATEENSPKARTKEGQTQN
ncbi:hypothetical protein GDO81_010654 [Engystomops pustulosus]|uniref:Uncharacterized protein n=1 Tax=Engystomops pustulosus TaxID=76066 RepID=A0AAV7C1Q1_ENGPU|nr:hypothetical protein GDO81_010654 [Engystomops pustulosus]